MLSRRESSARWFADQASESLLADHLKDPIEELVVPNVMMWAPRKVNRRANSPAQASDRRAKNSRSSEDLDKVKLKRDHLGR